MKKPVWFKVFLTMMVLMTLGSHSTILAQENVPESETAPEIRAAISPMISYQGRLVEDGVPVNGNRQMTFALETTGGGEIWSMSATTVNVVNGLFQVNLGPFPEGKVREMGQDMWLKVKVEGLVLPRQQLLGAPYAFSLAPGAVVSGATNYPTLSVYNNGSSMGIYGFSADSIGLWASSTNSKGMYGTSTNSIGVSGESTNNIGVAAFSYAAGVPALRARSASPDGIAISALANSTLASVKVKNTGTGPLLEGYAGDADEFVPEFVVKNDGTVQQELGATGLVKAGALVKCAKIDSRVIRQFNNVIGAGSVTVVNMDLTGTCRVDVDFDLSQRYWVVSNPDPTPHIISCAEVPPDTLLCSRFDLTGDVVDGQIMLLIY
jgi:hypothetical protein